MENTPRSHFLSNLMRNYLFDSCNEMQSISDIYKITIWFDKFLETFIQFLHLQIALANLLGVFFIIGMN